MTNPRPRPALRKADDASVHPAAPRLEDSEQTDATSSDGASEGRAAKRHGKKSDKASEKTSEKEKALLLDLPKAVRKRLKAEAVTLGTTPEALAVEILERWADDGPTGTGRRRKG